MGGDHGDHDGLRFYELGEVDCVGDDVRHLLDGYLAVASRFANLGSIAADDVRKLFQSVVQFRRDSQHSKFTSAICLAARELLGTKAMAHSAKMPSPASSIVSTVSQCNRFERK